MRKLIVAITAVTICCLGNEYPASAQTTCRYSELLNTTTCSTPSGTYTGRHSNLLNQTTWSGPGGTTTCRYSSLLNQTTCN